MARPTDPSLSYYNMRCGHTTNPKIKLLVHDQKGLGYFIWACILDQIYSTTGYYFDCSQKDWLELFALDVCKETLETVEKVIKTCVKRDLFDKGIFDKHNILTSQHIQNFYIRGTNERRKKGSVIVLREELLLIELSEDLVNVSVSKQKTVISPDNFSIPPGNPTIPPGRNPQSKGKEKQKEKKINENKESIAPAGVVEAVASTGGLQKDFLKLEKSKKAICDFIKLHHPDFIEPYVELWNLFATEKGLSKVSKISDARRRKFKVRIKEKSFDFLEILKKAKQSEFLLTGKWFGFDWVLANEANYLKIIEGNYDKKSAAEITQTKKSVVDGPQDLEYLQERFMEGQLDIKTISEKHYLQLEQQGVVSITDEIIHWRINSLTGSNIFSESSLCQDYQSGKETPAVMADRINLMRLAIIKYFKGLKTVAA